MARNLLTAMGIKNSIKPKLRDGDGLWLHQGKNGSRYWVFIYIRYGRRREMGLGPYGSGTGSVSIVAARKKADEIRGILGHGGDPFTEMEERQARVKPKTFGEVADLYIKDMRSRWRGAKTEVSWKRSVEVHAKTLRKIPVGEVTTSDVVRALRPIWESKPESASKARERIKMVLDSARAQGLRTGDNPAEWKGHLDQILVAQDRLSRGHHAAMPYTQVPSFYRVLRDANGMGARALEFAILTAARGGEVRGATWGEFNLDGAVWVIPAERMKAGREHRVPLSDPAVSLLRNMLEVSISDLVFPSRSPRKALSDMTMAKALKSNGGAGFTVHGFRSTFRDWVAEETDFQREVAEAALSHSVGNAVERAYRRGDVLSKRRTMMQAWSDYCEGGAPFITKQNA